MKKHILFRGFIGAIALLGFSTAAMAGAGGSEFDDVYTQLVDWSQGTLGKVISLGMILTGIGIGVVRQSVMAIAVGVGAGLSLYNAPKVIDNIFTAIL